MSFTDQNPFDFHVHTTLSDGDETLDELCCAAAQAGIKHLGVTDHDAVHPHEALHAAGKKHNIHVVSGCEISCYWPTRDGAQAINHLGAHWLKPNDPGLMQILRHNQSQDFAGRVLALLRACEKQGLRPYGASVEENFQRILMTHPDSLHYGKRAVAQLMEQSGCVTHRKQAYDLMARGGSAYVPVTDHMHFVSFWDAMEAITQNSLCTLNHLHYAGLDATDEKQLLLDFEDAGGDALEALYHRYTKDERWALSMAAEELGLMTNAGSDRHDPSRPFMQGYGLMYLALSIRQKQKHGSLWE